MLLALLEVLSGQKLVSLMVISTACDLAADFKLFISSDLSGLNFNLIWYNKDQTRQITERFSHFLVFIYIITVCFWNLKNSNRLNAVHVKWGTSTWKYSLIVFLLVCLNWIEKPRLTRTDHSSKTHAQRRQRHTRTSWGFYLANIALGLSLSYWSGCL